MKLNFFIIFVAFHHVATAIIYPSFLRLFVSNKKNDIQHAGCDSESPLKTEENGKMKRSSSGGNIIRKDIVIIGSGPSGCTAAIYAGRSLLNPLVIAGYNFGGQLMLTSDVENFPGYQTAVSGPQLMDDLTCQAKKFGAEFWATNCQSIDVSSHPFSIKTSNCTILAKSIIISTGAEALWLNAGRENEFKGKGISTCATCDGYMFRNKPVLVIGGGDSAMEEATFLTRFASSVTLVHRRDSFRASKVQSFPLIKKMTFVYFDIYSAGHAKTGYGESKD